MKYYSVIQVNEIQEERAKGRNETQMIFLIPKNIGTASPILLTYRKEKIVKSS